MKRERVLTDGITFYTTRETRNDLEGIAVARRINLSMLLRDIIEQYIMKGIKNDSD